VDGVKGKDKHGQETTRQIHTLGDSVIRVKDHYYLSAVDETGSSSMACISLLNLLPTARLKGLRTLSMR